ncbi:discoidin domain-containing protein [Bifidobacterium leontopitheci]|uniref:F5/8 type C domain-containing protein n=1 Tax=Bifidobacterium leontopitheci TaxID=2650774 RepID=A0A6I1GEI8_9BIFI|nr:discoidin domain-containing protein [Bifidobacterium leontopitheci]KAB7789955.1 F5/8 type C domain-containing protein [Bifidobacterium leontopitheci]
MEHAVKRFKACALATIVAMALSPFALQAQAKAADAAGVGGDVSVTQTDNSLTVGNGALSRTFSTASNKLSTTEINNKRANVKYTPASGSEEFVVKMTKNTGDTKPPTAIDRTGWEASASSAETSGENSPASNAIDGNTSTIWHSQYSSGNIQLRTGHWLMLALGKETTFKAFSYTPRPSGANGNVKGYKLMYSNDTTAPSATDANAWTEAKSGEFTYDGVNPIYVNLDSAVTARYVKFVPTSSVNGAKFAGCAEFNLYADTYTAPSAGQDYDFAASELTLAGKPEVKDTTATINKVKKTGKEVVFTFKPHQFRDVDYTISEHVVMYNGDHYMRKFLSISVPKAQQDDAILDYIDLESLKVTAGKDTTWTIPTNAGGVVAMDQFKANLGQPIYVDGMFMGSEFPETDTQIVNNTGYMRYYTGKSFARLVTDQQAGASADGQSIVYNTWQTVVGAARSTDNSVIQSDFYDYITDIATPTEFRTQYNSWFDNMMKIDDTNILDSFKAVDKDLNAAGAEPLGSYVVDDGWNNYNPTETSVDVERSGTGKNTAGFWTFNSKFPNGLTPSSKLVQKLGSNFGVWVGPRGGYNFYGQLADILTASGKGSKAGGSIDVADREYVKNFAKMSTDWQDKYKVNYWKWDGFADQAQFNAFPATDGVPGYANRHMTGGTNNMYHVTDLWEAWIDLFDQVRANAEKNGIDLWISLTCYVNPSPWFLQWANSVWLQCVYDQTDAGASASKMDRQLTYRDATYYDFIKNHEFQFPLGNVYNHDPIYGKEGTNITATTATDVQFANYLYTQASRGTAFWELYYSDSLMSEGKWQVTSEFLKWAKENHHILRNAKMFGVSPNSAVKLNTTTNNNDLGGAYGFSAFDGEDGLVMVRNSSTTAKDITYKFDATNGVQIDSGTYNVTLDRVYNPKDSAEAKDTPSDAKVTSTTTFDYGKSHTFNLQPDESITFRVSKTTDKTAPKIASIAADGKTDVRVKFDEPVKASADVPFELTGAEIASVKASADRATFDITLKDAPANGTKLTVKAGDKIADRAGNKADDTASVTYRAGNKVTSSPEADYDGTTKNLGTKGRSLDSAGGFTVDLDVTTTSTNATLVAQPKGYTVAIDKDGYPTVALNGATATADVKVNDGKKHSITAVKENNGMLKVYVDGALAGSVYKAGNMTYTIPAGRATTGSKAFAGKLAVAVYDTAWGYDDIAAADAPATVENVALNKNASVHWMDGSEAPTDQGRPASMAVDGNSTDTANNYVGFGSDDKTEGSYLQVDFGAVYDIENTEGGAEGAAKMYRYWADSRTYNGTVVMLSENGTFAEGDRTIIYNSDKENFFKFGAGTENTYAETSAGKAFNVPAGTKARYVRVYMHGRNGGNTNHIVELQVFGKKIAGETTPDAVDKSELQARLAELAKVDTTGKTADSVAKFKAAVEAAKKVLDDADATQAQVDDAVNSLEGIEKVLVDETPEVTVDKSALKARLEELAKVDLTGKTEASVKAFKDVIAAATAVYEDADATQAEVDQALKSLEGLEKVLVDEPVNPEPGKVDKTALKKRLEELAKVSTDGKTAASVATFRKAIAAAQAVLDNPNATKADVDAALKSLDGIEKVLTDEKTPQPKPQPNKKPGLSNTGADVTAVAVAAAAVALAGAAALTLRRRRS